MLIDDDGDGEVEDANNAEEGEDDDVMSGERLTWRHGSETSIDDDDDGDDDDEEEEEGASAATTTTISRSSSTAGGDGSRTTGLSAKEEEEEDDIILRIWELCVDYWTGRIVEGRRGGGGAGTDQHEEMRSGNIITIYMQ